MIRDFFLLNKLGFYQLRNRMLDGFRSRPGGMALLLLLGGGFFYGYLYLAWLLLDFIYQQEVYGLLFATRLVEFLLFIAVGMALMSSLTTAIATFYLSKDLEFQFSLPVSFHAWVSYRFSQVFFQSSWMLLLFGGSFIWIYLYLGGTPVWVQAIGLLAFAILCSFPILFSTMLCMILVKIFPAKRVHQVFLVLTVVLVSSVIFLFRYLEPEQFIGPGGLERFSGFIDLVSPRKQPYNPAVWCANLMASLNQQEWSEALPHAGRLFGLFAVAMGTFLVLARKLYRSSWDRALQSLSGEGDLRPTEQGANWLSRHLGHPVFSQEIRELLLFFRDPSQWSQIFVLIALLGLYLFSITRVPSNLLGASAYLMALLNTVFVAFISLSIASRFVFTSFSADGQAIWLMKTAPEGWYKFIRSKILVFGLPCLVFSMVLSVSSAYLLELRDAQLWDIALAALWDSTLMILLSLALGMLFVNPGVENPLKMIVSPGGLFLMAAGLFFAALHLVVRLTIHLPFINQALEPYGWPDMQRGGHVGYVAALIGLEVVLVMWLSKRGISHLRQGGYGG